MRKFLALLSLSLVLAMYFAAWPPAPAQAGLVNWKQFCDRYADSDTGLDGWCLLFLGLHGHNLASQAAAAPAASDVEAATFHIDNFFAGLDVGEPTMGGLVTRTVWGTIRLSKPRRVVVHTFGSAFDTVLAVYTGKRIETLKRIAGNDNRNVPGLYGTHSLVQFDAEADTTYSVQMGGRDEAQGKIVASVFSFPPAGGLAAFLADVGGNPLYNGRDHVCDIQPCGDATFVLYNAGDETLSVTARTTLGPGITAPAPFNIPPGAVRVASFHFTNQFDHFTARTSTGHFIFTGTANGKTLAETRTRALFTRQALTATTLKAKVTPAIGAGYLNEAQEFTATIENTGTSKANGCHFRSYNLTTPYLKTEFQRIDPDLGTALAPRNEPDEIPAGRTHSFRLRVASMNPTSADLEFPANVIVTCTNSLPALFDPVNNFGVTAHPNSVPDVEVTLTAPGGTLTVPPGGATFSVRVINRGPTQLLMARPRYIYVFGDEADELYAVSVCELRDNGTCKAPFAASVSFEAERDVASEFAVRVMPPANDPGFLPRLRRVFLQVELPTDSPRPALGAVSVAPKL